jgi:hypothetical protein
MRHHLIINASSVIIIMTPSRHHVITTPSRLINRHGNRISSAALPCQ